MLGECDYEVCAAVLDRRGVFRIDRGSPFRLLRDNAVLILLTDPMFGATVEHQLKTLHVPAMHAPAPEVSCKSFVFFFLGLLSRNGREF